MNRAAIVFPALILLVVAALSAYALLFYTWTALVFPVGIGGIVCAMCIGELAAALAGKAPLPTADDERMGAPSLRSVGWIFALAPFLYGLGFVLGPACYLLACLRGNGYSWRVSGAIAASSAAIVWGVFIKTIGILLPVAPLWMG